MITEEEALFNSIGESIKNAVKGQMFGKPCFKLNKKAFICFFRSAMVFKLTDEIHREALGLAGSELFDPSGKKRPMKAWVRVPFKYKNRWKLFAEQSARYVGEK